MTQYVTLMHSMSAPTLRLLVPHAEALADAATDRFTKAELTNWRNYLRSSLQHCKPETPDDGLGFLD